MTNGKKITKYGRGLAKRLGVTKKVGRKIKKTIMKKKRKYHKRMMKKP